MNSRICFISVLIALLLSEILPCFANTWALLVGIEDYKDKRISDLKYTVSDVNNFYNTLIDPGVYNIPKGNIYLMTSNTDNIEGDDYPKATNVVLRLKNLVDRIQPEDTFIFYFSGHGMVNEKQQYLLTIDSDPRATETLTMSAIPIESINRLLSKVKAQQIVMILDVCRNDPEQGKGDRDNKLTDELVKGFKLNHNQPEGGLPTSIATFYACAIGERAYEWDEMKSGVFSYFLVEGLKGGAADSSDKITMQGLEKYITSKVEEWSNKNMLKQHPWLETEGSDIILANLMQNIGRLDINVEPEGSQIFVNDKNSGQTPKKLELPEGEYKIEIRCDGYKSLLRDNFNIINGKAYTISDSLEQMKGFLQITSQPSDVNISIEKKDYGTNPGLIPLPTGNYDVKLSKLGYYDDTKKIDIEWNKTTILNVNLKPKKTTLCVEVNPPEGFISIKGVAEGYKKINLSEATPGNYTIIAHLQDFETKTINLTLNPGDEKHELITLERVKVKLQIDSNPQGASVKLDSFEHGITPLTLEGVPTGEHNLTLVLKNYESISKNVTVNSVPQTLTFQFLRSKGTIIIKSTPSGAAVDFVDNVQKRISWQELTPTLVKIDNGEYTLELRKLNYQTTSKKITINEGTNPEIMVTLQENNNSSLVIEDTSLGTPTDNLKATNSDKVITVNKLNTLSFLPYLKSLEHNNISCGSIRLLSPSDANIYLDEKPIANLGIDDSVILQSEAKDFMTFHNLFPGTHTILVTKKNYNSALNHVMVKPGLSTDLDVKLHNRWYFQFNVFVWVSVVTIAAVSLYYFVY